MPITRKQKKDRQRQRAAERVACPLHGYERHGKEAHELRRGLEELVKDAVDLRSETVQNILDNMYVRVEDIESLLERVDARDALAYEEKAVVEEMAWREADTDKMRREAYGNAEGEYGVVHRERGQRRWTATVYVYGSKEVATLREGKVWVETIVRAQQKVGAYG